MKKFFILIAASLLAVPSFAIGPVEDPEDESVVNFDVLDHFGFGVHGITPAADDANAKQFDSWSKFGYNTEIFFNIVTLSIHPYPTGTILIGADVDWDSYRIGKNKEGESTYWMLDNNNCISPVVAHRYSKVNKTHLRVWGFDFPIEFKQKIGDFSITLGGALELNMAGTTKFKGVVNTSLGGSEETTLSTFKANDIEVNRFGYHLTAKLQFFNFGLYAKYNPVPQFDGVNGPKFTTWTVGLIIG